MPADEKGSATSYARECERYCRLLETAPQHPKDVDHAERIGAITKDEAAQLRAQQPVDAPNPTGPWTIKQAAAAHPSTQREDQWEAERHYKELQEFCDWAKVSLISDIRLDQVQAWILLLKSRGYSFDGRRHRLLFLRRASRMATTCGLPDVLGELVLDRRDGHTPVKTWTLEQLCRAVLAFQVKGELRQLLATALGGFVGLRSSEIARVRIGDRTDAVLQVGKRVAKNNPSRRSVVLPSIVCEWFDQLAGDRGTDEPLIARQREKRGTGHLTSHGFARLLDGRLAEHTGLALPPKALRKSFSTWAIAAKVDVSHVEHYLGHQRSDVEDVTYRHYLGEKLLAELAPTAVKLDEAIRACLHKVSTEAVNHLLDAGVA